MRGGREQEIRELVGEDAVDLLRHAAIVGAEPGLHVADRHAELLRGQRGGQHRVRVAFHQHHVRPLAHDHRLHPAHDRGDLVGLRARSDLEVHVGTRETELLEEHAVHVEGVVLSGVEQRQLGVSRAGRRAPPAPS